MQSLINDKETARQYVRINFINDVSSLPDFQLAAERYLIPIIGQNLYDDLLADVLDVDFPDDPPPDPLPVYADADLVRLCRAVIAPLGYLMELATIQTQITDAGLRSISTDHSQAAHRWEYNEIKDHLEDKGAYAIEALLKYLFSDEDPLWIASDEYEELNKLIFKTGAEFNKFFTVHHPHRVFWELRPLMMEVQDLYINSTIGKTFFIGLKDNAAPTDIETEAIKLIKKAVAQFTIVKAIEKLSVKKTVKGFTVMLSAGNSDSANAGDAPQRDSELDLLYKSCTRSGDAYLVQLKEHLDKNASATVLQVYFESSYYTDPTATVCDRNKNRKIFGL